MYNDKILDSEKLIGLDRFECENLTIDINNVDWGEPDDLDLDFQLTIKKKEAVKNNIEPPKSKFNGFFD